MQRCKGRLLTCQPRIFLTTVNAASPWRSFFRGVHFASHFVVFVIRAEDLVDVVKQIAPCRDALLLGTLL